MIKIKIESDSFEKLLQNHENIKKEYNKAIEKMADELFKESYAKYWGRLFLFYHCPNIMRKLFNKFF